MRIKQVNKMMNDDSKKDTQSKENLEFLRLAKRVGTNFTFPTISVQAAHEGNEHL